MLFCTKEVTAMKQETTILTETCALLSRQRLPRWRELPDLDLYMDQILSLVGRYLGDYPGFDGKGLTASMVNNYVKQQVMPAPVKKKYTKTHLAYLLVICLLKPVLPIPAIRQLLSDAVAAQSAEAFYDDFCQQFEDNCLAAAESSAAGAESRGDALCRAALRAQAEQALALRLAASAAEK